MEGLLIKRTLYTPKIEFKLNGDFTIEGISAPENVNMMYEPMFNWINEFKNTKPEVINFTMFFEYLNTSSTKILVGFILQLKTIISDNNQLKLVWISEEDDEDMIDLAEELEIVTGMKIKTKIIPAT